MAIKKQQWQECTRFASYHYKYLSKTVCCAPPNTSTRVFLLSCHAPRYATQPQFHNMNQQLCTIAWNAALKLLQTLETKKFISPPKLFCCMTTEHDGRTQKAKPFQGGSCQFNVEGTIVTSPCDDTATLHQGLNIVPWSRHFQFCSLSPCSHSLHLHTTIAFNTCTSQPLPNLF